MICSAMDTDNNIFAYFENIKSRAECQRNVHLTDPLMVTSV